MVASAAAGLVSRSRNESAVKPGVAAELGDRAGGRVEDDDVVAVDGVGRRHVAALAGDRQLVAAGRRRRARELVAGRPSNVPDVAFWTSVSDLPGARRRAGGDATTSTCWFAKSGTPRTSAVTRRSPT